jgi:hypothetical protein
MLDVLLSSVAGSFRSWRAAEKPTGTGNGTIVTDYGNRHVRQLITLFLPFCRFAFCGTNNESERYSRTVGRQPTTQRLVPLFCSQLGIFTTLILLTVK